MAFGALAARGSNNAITADTSIAVNPSPTDITAGDRYALALVAKDNDATSSGQVTEVTSISDSKGNTWNRLYEYAYAGGSPGANAGVTTSLWAARIGTTILTTDTITAAYSSVTCKILSVAEFTVGAGNTIAIAGTPQVVTGSGATPSSTISGLDSKEYLFLVACGLETRATVGAITNYTALLNVVADNTTNAASIRGLLRYRILTGTGDTATGASMGADKSWIHLALEEVAGVTAAVTGTAGDGCVEADIVTGGQTIILTLTGDTWVAAGATFDAQRQNIIDGLDSAQAEAAGWDAQRTNIAVTAVARTSATVVTITLPALAGYAITATETITATIPATALTGAAQIVATPTFDITPDSSGSPVTMGDLPVVTIGIVVADGSGVTIESGPTPTQPDTPTCTVTGQSSTAVQAISSGFVDADNDLHAASQWQVDIAAGDFSSPVVDSNETITALESISLGGLTPSTDYQIRVRHKDDSADAGTEWSEWSTADTFTTTAAPSGTAHHGRGNGQNRRRFGGLWD
jgi:hypothetical protein